jgi:5-methylcytosine-specific restriction endonuclease McrA
MSLSATELRAKLCALHEGRWARQAAGRADRRRHGPTRADRKAILLKADGRCHICGGSIETDEAWQADHVLARSSGGKYSLENYLPAHALCNNYRWDYSAEEFQLILKLGVWLRTQIERGTTIGLTAATAFAGHERSRAGRSKRRS